MNVIKSYKKRKKSGYLFWIIAIIVFVLLFIFLYTDILKSDDINGAENIVEKVAKDVVGVTSSNADGSLWGSGIVVSRYGYILTNEHLIDDNKECYVWINPSKKLKASSIWKSTELDLAILKVDATFKSCASLAEDNMARLGDDVFVIGNPINTDFSKTVTKGIISGLNRNLEFDESGKHFYLTGLIQTDAVINSGNSGGALINSSGQVIGISTIKITSAEAMGFAIPTNFIVPIVEKIEQTGKFSEPQIGLSGYDKYSVAKLNLGINMDNGIFVAAVNTDSSAEKSGLRAGDIITELDGVKINSIWDFRKYIYEKNIGESVNLKIKRDISQHEISVKII